ncbi:MAG TPA: 30S ribosomal protein S20 [bacterium]|nr:30S ribosomal protein S20 [bacterium]HPP11352.1 30S ribosomal protein S20 [bacterium]
MARRKTTVLKRQRQIARRTRYNKSVRSRLKTLARKVRLTASSGQGEVKKLLSVASSELDRAGARGIIHWRAASRKRSRLQRWVNKFSNQTSK